MPARASACRPSSTSSTATSTPRSPPRPSAPAAAISRASSISTRAPTTACSPTWPSSTADGIVGKVRDVFPHTAQVLVINDQTSGAGVILETTRIRGILPGNAAGQLEIVGILADERIKPGEKVLTAGGDLVFPRGLPVGVVEKVVPDPDRDAFIDIIVKPLRPSRPARRSPRHHQHPASLLAPGRTGSWPPAKPSKALRPMPSRSS